MKKIEQWLGAMNIQKKLIFAYLLFGVLPLLLVTVYTYHNTKNYLLDRAQKEMTYSLKQLSYEIREVISRYDVVMDQLYINSELFGYLNGDYRSQGYEGLFYFTDELFRYTMALYPDIESISIYSTNETLPEDFYYFYHLREGEEPDWYGKVIEQGRTIINGSGAGAGQNESDIIFLKELNLFETSGNVHILKIEVSGNAISSLLKNTSPGTVQYVTDTDGKATFFSGADEMTDAAIPLEGMIAFSEEIPEFGTAFVLADKKSFTWEIWKNAVLVFFWSFLISGIAFFCMHDYIRYFFRKRVECIREGIGMIGKGELDYRLPPLGTDEIGEIAGYLNGLAQQLEQLIENSYKKELEIKRVELNLLQEQINPHFLYNSLSMMAALAFHQGDESVHDMALSLSDFYRISLNHGRQTLQIREEVELLNSYLKVQNARFGDKVRVEYEIEESVLSCETLKLVLQPVVENAIKHGRKNDLDVLVILIHIYSCVDRVRFEIIDDGIGLLPEEVWKIHEDLELGVGGFGLRNVNARIKQSYGDTYGLFMESEYDFGTKVTIEIPYRNGVEKEI